MTSTAEMYQSFDIADLAVPIPVRVMADYSDREIYPLDAPGMPPLGSDFLTMANTLRKDGKDSDELVEMDHPALVSVMRQWLYSAGTHQAFVTVRGNVSTNLKIVTGHLWPGDTTGPKPSPVMILGKMLGRDEQTKNRNLVGPSGTLLSSHILSLVDPEVWKSWYVTNLIKTIHPEGLGNSILKQSWIREWLPVLHQELRIVRPKIILCLGSDALKALIGRSATIKSMEGRVAEFTYPVSREAGGELEYHTALVMSVTHPAAVLKNPELEERFSTSLKRFVQLTEGQRWDKAEEGLDHRVIYNLEDLKNLAAEIDANIEDNLLGVDAEWHGQHPQNQGAYLRSFQVSWKHKTAATIALRRQYGTPVYEDDREAREIILKICEGRQLTGHFFDADMEFLTAFGIDLREQYRVPKTWAEYRKVCLSGKPCGFDTGLAAHAISETDDFSLTSQALRYTTAPRYDMKLLAWKKQFCKEHNLKDAELEGFGDCPDDVLFGESTGGTQVRFSYAGYDADVTRRLAMARRKLLDHDEFNNNCWESFWMTMRALPVVLEINVTGLVLDRERLQHLTEIYIETKDKLRDRIRKWAKWPDMNLASLQQTREFLFGKDFNGKLVKPGEPPMRLRPEGARTLGLTPTITTDKFPILWEEVVEKKMTDKTPSTGKTALSLLAQESRRVVRKSKQGKEVIFDLSEPVQLFQDYRFIEQILKSSLRPPVMDKLADGTEVVRLDHLGEAAYSGGIPATICDDGRVRTHIYPTLETGRWASARPPLQNLSKRRENDYRRILAEDYPYPIRTMLRSAPGTVLVESDYVGAELFGMAIQSGDKALIAHATRNQLPECDPNFYDIHSNVSVLAFGLDCAPTKTGLKSIGKSHLRVVAKSVVFGIAYGRGAKAIALAAKEEKVDITEHEAQSVIDAIFNMYPDLAPYFEECRVRSLKERWLCNAFGRFRRFPRHNGDRKTQGEFERQAMNFTVQSLIADAVNLAVANFDDYRRFLSPDDDFSFSITLQIHDAILFQTEGQHVQRLIEEVIPTCMTDGVPIFASYLTGMPKPNAIPHYLGIDTEVFEYWGEQLQPDRCLANGFDPKYSGWVSVPGGYRHQHNPDNFVKI